MPPTFSQNQNLDRPKPKPDLSLVPSRKSDRKRKSRVIPDSSPTFKISQASASGAHKSWTDSEEIALLKAAARFRAKTGLPPRTPDMDEFFESVKRSFGSGMNQVRVFYKLKRLKSKFFQADGSLNGPHDRLVYKLSAEVWGSEADADAEASPKRGREIEEVVNCEEDGEMGNGNANCALVTEVLRDYWKENVTSGTLLEEGLRLIESARDYWRENVTSGTLLEEGLRLIDPTRAMKLERKWREQVESEMRFKMKRHEVFKEVYSLLANAVKNS